MHGGKFALIGLSGNIRIGSFLVAAEPCSFNSLSLLGIHKVDKFPIGINVRRGPRLLMNFDDRMGQCRDKGWMWGRVGALCLSCWQRDPVGTAWSKQVASPRGQAPDLFPQCSSEEVIELRKECETKGERDAGMECGDVAKDVGAGDLWRGEAGR